MSFLKRQIPFLLLLSLSAAGAACAEPSTGQPGGRSGSEERDREDATDEEGDRRTPPDASATASDRATSHPEGRADASVGRDTGDDEEEGEPDASASTGDESDAETSPSPDEETPREPPDTEAAPTGALPPVDDLAAPGPFGSMRTAGPSGFVLFLPEELGKDGVKHPIVSWGPGAVENAASFTTLLNHLASHGFAVISYDGTPQGDELVRAIDWMLAENERAGSMLHQKLDPSKISAGGHSAGSLATFRIGADERLTTTMHLCGGTFSPHTDIENLHAPALFICGEAGGDGLLVGDVARPNCDIDFMNATVPVFYGIPEGASHMSPTEVGSPMLRSTFAAACAGWLRLHLAGDEALRKMFVGDDCTLCKDSSWTARQKNWN